MRVKSKGRGFKKKLRLKSRSDRKRSKREQSGKPKKLS
jgi:hypothetical protein